MAVSGSQETLPPAQQATDFGSTVHRLVNRVTGNEMVEVYDDLADEVPVALEYNGISHAVMLATPAALEEFAIGFSLSEGIVGSLGDIFEVEVEQGGAGITIHLRIEGAAFMKLKERRRNLTGRTGCGLCGTEDLGQVMRPLNRLPARALAASAVRRGLAGLKRFQPLNSLTGATHAAAWSDLNGNVIAAFEDVGRHNALDKLIGFMARGRLDPAEGFLLMTSRASVELVQKAAMIGIASLVAISAPTALAVRTAEACGMTLLAFARGEQFVAYAHAGNVMLDS
jgi:formate dehydrogenase accessory protein FdhD